MKCVMKFVLRVASTSCISTGIPGIVSSAKREITERVHILMRRSGASDLHLTVPKYSADASNAALRTPSIASSISYTHRERPQMSRTMSTTSMMSSDGEGTPESEWTTKQEQVLQMTYEKELRTYSHNNPPFVPSAPPPVLLSKVSKKTMKSETPWPHTLAQTRKHLLLLIRRNAPEPASPHVAPTKPTANSMFAITHDLPGFFNNARGGSNADSLNSPFDERTFDFDKPISPKKDKHSVQTQKGRPDLMKQGSFGFGVPLTPSRKSNRINAADRPSTPSGSRTSTPWKLRTPSKQRAQATSTSPTRRLGERNDVTMPDNIADLMLSPRRSSRLRDTQDLHGLKRTSSSLSTTE